MVVQTERLVRSVVGRTMLRGKVVGINEEGLIEISANGQSFQCEILDGIQSNTNPLSDDDIVLFVPPDEEIPLGCVLGRIGRYRSAKKSAEAPVPPDHEIIESKNIEIQAGSSLVLKCGKGSISIQNDGTIVIKGSRLLSRSSGVNKIKGAAVQIN